MVAGGIFFGKFIAASFLRDDMDEYRTLQVFDVFKIFNQIVKSVPLQRADIGKAQLLK